MLKTWKEIANWYDWHGFHDAAQAARDKESDLRRFGNVANIARGLAFYGNWNRKGSR